MHKYFTLIFDISTPIWRLNSYNYDFLKLLFVFNSRNIYVYIIFDNRKQEKNTRRKDIKAEKRDHNISHLEQLFFSKLFKLSDFNSFFLVNMIHAPCARSLL